MYIELLPDFQVRTPAQKAYRSKVPALSNVERQQLLVLLYQSADNKSNQSGYKTDKTLSS